jgi:cobyrinic acid a,c-diamide synthase
MGYSSFDPGVGIRGTILNRVGSPRHLDMLKKSLALPIYAALPRKKDVEMKSRHLGLEMGFERSHDLAALASLMEEHSNLDQILKLSCTPAPAQEAEAEREKSVRIGIAQDEAFCFYYYDNFRELKRRGAELVYFSPMRDALPDVDGLYIGGGYPELHAAALERGQAKSQIKKASLDGMPIYGECGGLMYLSQGLDSGDEKYQMTGALPGTVIMTKRLQALGYVEAEVVEENPVASTGQIVRGHEFHYSRLEVDKDARFAYRLRRGKGINDGRDGLVEHNTMAGYLHTHFYSYAVDRFVEGCKAYRRR